jgi:hypothetical protein
MNSFDEKKVRKEHIMHHLIFVTFRYFIFGAMSAGDPSIVSLNFLYILIALFKLYRSSNGRRESLNRATNGVALKASG